MTPAQLALAANRIGGDIDSCRFALAELAFVARQQGVPGWAGVIGQCPTIRRAEATVREWAQAMDFRNRLSRQYDLPFSFFVFLAHHERRIPLDVLEDLMAEADGHCSLDEMRALVASILSTRTLDLCDFLYGEYARVLKARRAAETDDARAALDAVLNCIDEQRSIRMSTRV